MGLRASDTLNPKPEALNPNRSFEILGETEFKGFRVEDLGLRFEGRAPSSDPVDGNLNRISGSVIFQDPQGPFNRALMALNSGYLGILEGSWGGLGPGV